MFSYEAARVCVRESVRCCSGAACVCMESSVDAHAHALAQDVPSSSTHGHERLTFFLLIPGKHKCFNPSGSIQSDRARAQKKQNVLPYVERALEPRRAVLQTGPLHTARCLYYICVT